MMKTPSNFFKKIRGVLSYLKLEGVLTSKKLLVKTVVNKKIINNLEKFKFNGLINKPF